MNTKLPSVSLSGLQLSDLFFNSALTNYGVACEKNSRAKDDVIDTKAALLEDAKEFAEMTGGQVDAAELIEDFLARV